MDSLLYALREATDIRPLKHIHFILFLIVFLETRCVPPCNAIFLTSSFGFGNKNRKSYVPSTILQLLKLLPGICLSSYLCRQH